MPLLGIYLKFFVNLAEVYIKLLFLGELAKYLGGD